jgi:hypothetical protein
MSGSVVIYEPADGLRLAPPTQDEARAIAGWRYQPPYDVYDLIPERVDPERTRRVGGEKRRLRSGRRARERTRAVRPAHPFADNNLGEPRRRFELLTSTLQEWRSGQLSYRGNAAQS